MGKFWKKKSKSNLGKLFALFEIPEYDHFGVEILKGKYKGVKYLYSYVKFMEGGTLKFEYDVLEPNGIENISGKPDFINTIGDILMELILDEEGYNETSRRTDT